MTDATDPDERKCYLCDKKILQISGQEFKLRCEKGSPITVCEDCYEEAASESCDWETFK